jgi:hypothetical protein
VLLFNAFPVITSRLRRSNPEIKKNTHEKSNTKTPFPSLRGTKCRGNPEDEKQHSVIASGATQSRKCQY